MTDNEADMREPPVTERATDAYADLDLRSTLELVEVINGEDAQVAPAVLRAAPQLAAAIDAIADRLTRGGRLIYVGAGSSGRLALVDALECGPTFGTTPNQVLAIVAGGGMLGLAEEAAEDDASAGAADLAAARVTASDAVVGISAGGATRYVLAALEAARDAGALTVALVCAEGSEIGASADVEVVMLVGPEVIAGSTRMKAGTAQKLALNMVSTISMIRLGKTYGNLMVEVSATNEKLRGRVRRIVHLATGEPTEHADAALADAGGSAKVAIVSLLAGLDADAARALLARSDNNVRAALEAL
jgi:N-acetylmuramic acid 6-phosphate etherase